MAHSRVGAGAAASSLPPSPSPPAPAPLPRLSRRALCARALRRAASWPRLLLLLAALYCFAGNEQWVTPVPELVDVLPAVAAAWLQSGAPRPPLPCAPCGCGSSSGSSAGGVDASASASASASSSAAAAAAPFAFCLGDTELRALAAQDAPLRADVAAAERARLLPLLRERQSTHECVATLGMVHAASAAAAAAAAAAAVAGAAPAADASADASDAAAASAVAAAAASGVRSPAPAPAGSGGDAAGLPPWTRGHTLFHWYWRSDLGPLGPAQVAVAEAWAATQDLSRSTLLVWVPAGAGTGAGTGAGAGAGAEAPLAALEPLARLFPGRVRFRVLDLAAEAEGTPLQRSFLLRLRDRFAWVDSDVARLVVLWRYGGVYLDADLLLLRDVAPLLALEFATEFSCDHAQGVFNNAVMRIVARSAAATALLERAKAIWPRVRSWAYGPTLLRDAAAAAAAASAAATPGAGAGAAVLKLPWCFFHGIWCEGALPPDAVGGAARWDGARAGVEAAFGLHLHRAGAGGAGAAPLHNGSVFATYARRHRAAVLARAAEGGAPAGDVERYRASPGIGAAAAA